MRSHAHADRSGGDTASEPTLTCCATLLAVYFILATSMFGVGMPAGRRLRVRVRASVGMPRRHRPLTTPAKPTDALPLPTDCDRLVLLPPLYLPLSPTASPPPPRHHLHPTPQVTSCPV